MEQSSTRFFLSDVGDKGHAPPHRQWNPESAGVDREVSTGLAELTVVEVSKTVPVESAGWALRRATSLLIEVAFVVGCHLRGYPPTRLPTLAPEFVVQHPLQGDLPAHSHCHCRCGRT